MRGCTYLDGFGNCFLRCAFVCRLSCVIRMCTTSSERQHFHVENISDDNKTESRKNLCFVFFSAQQIRFSSVLLVRL